MLKSPVNIVKDPFETCWCKTDPRNSYKDAISKITQCEKYDILSVTSFLEESISKVYITDLIQNFCMFNHEIITLIDEQTSNLSCVHRGKQRIERKLN